MVHGPLGRGRAGCGRHTRSMLKQALRFALLRFLPRRLVPILAAVEVIRLVQRLRRRGPEPVAPRRLVTVEGADRTVPADDRIRR